MKEESSTVPSIVSFEPATVVEVVVVGALVVVDAPELPELPEFPELPELPEFPEFPELPELCFALGCVVPFELQADRPKAVMTTSVPATRRRRPTGVGFQARSPTALGFRRICVTSPNPSGRPPP